MALPSAAASTVRSRGERCARSLVVVPPPGCDEFRTASGRTELSKQEARRRLIATVTRLTRFRTRGAFRHLSSPRLAEVEGSQGETGLHILFPRPLSANLEGKRAPGPASIGALLDQ